MKNLLKLINIAILFFTLCFQAYVQDVIPEDFEINPPISESNPYASAYGWYLPAHGTVRILVIYAEIEYDVGTDPDPASNQDEWMPHSLPNWADDLYDVNIPAGTAQGLVTRYFQEASSG